MTNSLEFKNGKLVAKLGPNWNNINDTTINVIANSCVDTLIEKRKMISAAHPKTFLLNDPVTSDIYVFIGYDTGKHSKKYAEIFASVFYRNGYRINMPDEPCLAPFVSYMANYNIFRCGIYVTGYPFGKDYCGVRLYLEDGCILTDLFASDINQKIKDRKFVECIDFVNEKFDYDNYLLMFAKHFSFGTNNTLINMFKNIQFQNQKRVVISCMYGPSLRVIEIAKETNSLQGIFCIYQPHSVLDPDFGNMERRDTVKNLLDDNLIRFADYYRSKYIFFLDSIGIQFRICAKQYNRWEMYTVDDIVSFFSYVFYNNTKPLDTMVINDYDCTNLGLVLSMSYGFRYYRGGLNNFTIQEAYCRYKRLDKQINNFFVYNPNFEFISYFGKEASNVHMTLLATIFIHYNIPDVCVQCTKMMFGEFKTKKIRFDDTSYEKIKANCVLQNFEYKEKKEILEFFSQKYVYVILYRKNDKLEVRIYFDTLIFDNTNDCVKNILKKLGLASENEIQ